MIPPEKKPEMEFPIDGLVPLESVLCTEELNRRPMRVPDYDLENRALVSLAQALADSPRTILQTLADKILEVFQADSAGVSLLTKDGKRFYWPAIAGVWKPHIGGGTPRNFGPCGDVLDRNAPLLFRHFELRYEYFLPVTPPVEECLLTPMYVDQKAVGTIWVIAHDKRRKFDSEDLRQLESLSKFASAAYQTVEFLDALEQRGKELAQTHTELSRRVAELQNVNLDLTHSRTAALNITEDAVLARRQAELAAAESKRAEESLKENQGHLQRAVAAADEANRMKDEFLASVSHELRTPLNAILGWAHMLQSKALEPEMADSAVDAIYMSAKNQAQIIDDLLDVARIISGKMNVHPAIVKLADILSAAMATVKHAINAKDIQLHLQYAKDAQSLSLYADGQRLQQVFWNLLSNAVKFTPRNGRIDIRVERIADEVQIVVRDTGVGIRPDVLQLIFERFRQADSTTTRKFGGLGLGLSIAKELVEIHGGTISANSEGENKGSRFIVRLPITYRQKNIAASQNLSTAIADWHGDYSVDLRDKRILLIDDDENTLRLLERAFERSGAHLRSSTSAKEGFEILKEWLPDLLISDIAMPDDDGYRLIDQVRSLPVPANLVPAIALTAYATAADRAKVLAAGFQMFVPKPVEPAELLGTAKALLDHESSNNRDASNFDSKHASTNATPVSVLTGKKILLVEDDLLSTEALRLELEREGSEVRSAASVSVALDVLQEWVPDIIVSDLGLPNEDGYALIKRIRALSAAECATIPAVALTGYGQEEGARAVAAGFNVYKRKPVELGVLISALIDLTKEQKPRTRIR